MGYDHNRARIEASLARAHRALVDAKTAAEFANDDSLYLDLQMLEVEVTRLADNSLRGKARKAIVQRGQLSIMDPEAC